MKFYSIIILFIISACQSKDNTILKSLISTENVFIKSDYKYSKDSLILDIPIEYRIINNASEEIDKSTIYMIHNGNILKDLDDFIVFDKNQYHLDKILNLKTVIKPEGHLDIIIRTNYIYIQKKEANKIFAKYKIDENLIKIKNSVKITSFDKFRKENPELMIQLTNYHDSIVVANYYKGIILFTNQKNIIW